MVDTGLKSPSATGEDYNQWSNPSNAFSSDDSYASEISTNQKQDYYDFSFGIPEDSTINGIEVKLESSFDPGGFGDGEIGVELSWDGGISYTTSSKSTGLLTVVDTIYTLGGSSDTWGRSWSDGEFSNANFRARINADQVAFQGTDFLDHIQITVYYTEEVTAGPNNPGTMANDASVGTEAWSDVDNAKVSDNTYAVTPVLQSGTP